MTSPALAAFIDLADPGDGCHQTRWPKSVEYLDANWLSARDALAMHRNSGMHS